MTALAHDIDGRLTGEDERDESERAQFCNRKT